VKITFSDQTRNYAPHPLEDNRLEEKKTKRLTTSSNEGNASTSYWKDIIEFGNKNDDSRNQSATEKTVRKIGEDKVWQPLGRSTGLKQK